jgi:single-strand DNA-binding protein
VADNLVTLVGAIGTEPELRTTQQGTDVVNFSLATNERMRNGEGRWVDGPTSWFRVAVWGGLGRNAHASLHKGQRVVVHGALRITEFSTETNGTSRRAEVRALALGHDLTFGTSAFTKGGVPAIAAAPPQSPAEQAPPVWSGDVAAEPAAATQQPAQPAWSRPMDEVETPF